MFVLFNDSDSVKFNELYETHKKAMLYTAMGILYNNKYLSEDAVHSAFERVLKNLDKIEDISSLKTKRFLVIITRNVAIDMRNKIKSTGTIPLDDLLGLHNKNSNVENILVSDETIKEMKDELSKMPVIYVDVYDLKHNCGLSNKVIAELLKITESTLRKRLQVVRDRLRPFLEEYKNGK